MAQCLGHANGFIHLDVSDNEHAFDLGYKFEELIPKEVGARPYSGLHVSCKQAHKDSGTLHYALAESKWVNGAGSTPADQELLLREAKQLLPPDLRALNSGAAPTAKMLRFV